MLQHLSVLTISRLLRSKQLSFCALLLYLCFMHLSVDLRSSSLVRHTQILPQNKDTICSDAVNLIFNPLLKVSEGNNNICKTKRSAAEFQNIYFIFDHFRRRSSEIHNFLCGETPFKMHNTCISLVN